MRRCLRKLTGFILAAAMMCTAGVPTYAQEETTAFDAADFAQSEAVNFEQTQDPDFHIYLCIGQSNMAGRAGFDDEDMTVLDRTYLFTGNGWETAKPVWNSNINKYEGLNRNSTVKDNAKYQGLNPAFYLAKTLGENVGENIKIGIVGSARGDTSINQWQKDYVETSGKADYDLYEKALAQAQEAQKYGVIKGIIWHHGCANAGTTGYTSKFKAMINNFRTDLGIADLPVFMGEIPGYGKDETQLQNRQGFNGTYIKTLSEGFDNCWYISSVGLSDIGDNTHFNTYSQRELGRRYGKIVLDKLYGIKDERDSVITINGAVADDCKNVENAELTTDGKADIHLYFNTSDKTSAYDHVMSAVTAFPAEYVIDCTQDASASQAASETDIYFRNVYTTIYQYKIYTSNDKENWRLAVDRSAQMRYDNVASDGSVINRLPSEAEYIKVVITGAVDYKGNAIESSRCAERDLGVDEFVMRGQGRAVLWSEDFEGYDTGVLLEATTGTKDFPGSANGVAYYNRRTSDGKLSIADDSTKYLKMTKTTSGSKDDISFYYSSYIADSDVYTVQFRYQAANAGSYTLNEGSKEGRGALLNMSASSGNIQYTDGGNTSTKITATGPQTGNWNEFKLVMRKTAKQYDLYINNELINKNIAVYDDASLSFGYMRFWIASSITNGEIYIDDIKVIEGEPEAEIKLKVTADGAEADSGFYGDGTVKVTVCPTAAASGTDYVLIMALYGEQENDLRKVNVFNRDSEKFTTVGTITIDNAADTRLKLMLFSSFDELIPIKSAKTLLGAAEAEE